MSMDIDTFQDRAQSILDRFDAYSNKVNEANAVRVALGADTTTRDATVQTAPVGLRPASRTQSAFTNALLLEVNKGKAGNLSTINMANVLGGLVVSPPTNTVPPTITYASGAPAGTVGSIYARGNGTWTPAGASFTQQWLRNGANIAGATGTTYTTVAADGGTTLSCRITATNEAGSNSAVSNTAAIAAP